MKRALLIIITLLALTSAHAADKPVSNSASLLPANWNPKRAADDVLTGLIKVTAPQVKGAHDASLTMVNDRAYILSMVNDERPGENPEWPFMYVTLSIVDIRSMTLEKIIPVARGEQVFENATLPPGACFVPRILRRDNHTLRCFFTSEEPGKRPSQMWFIDFNVDHLAFAKQIHKAKIKTDAGIFDLQPQPFYDDAVKHGFTHRATDYGLYLIDGFKFIEGKTYAVMNNYAAGQNALTLLNGAADTFEVIGHYNEPAELKLTESAVNRLPDGRWLAICRQEGGNHNYVFTTSKDGKAWTPGEPRPLVPNGASSKPVLEKMRHLYYLGWQEGTKINGANRSVFNLEISANAVNWERKYRFETERSFQYPSLCEHHGHIWFTVTQGDNSGERKERIMFGKLE